MKKAVLTVFSFLFVISIYAQDAPSKPAYLRFPIIPPFTLIKADSSTMTRDNLAKNRKTMFMYFSPNCDHCQHQTDSIVANMEKFKDVQILMATYEPVSEMKAFYEGRELSKYKNISMGNDSKYFFPPFYKMTNLPFIALYNRKGDFITSFEGTTGIDKILEALDR